MKASDLPIPPGDVALPSSAEGVGISEKLEVKFEGQDWIRLLLVFCCCFRFQIK